jgi:cell division protein FtsL
LNKVANSYWVDNRLAAQRPSPRAISITDSPATEVLGAYTRLVGMLPSWVIFTMITLAMLAICVTVTVRTHAEMKSAEEQYQMINTDLQNLKDTNAALENEISALKSNPRAIEAAARKNLGMVRPNEIVIRVK